LVGRTIDFIAPTSQRSRKISRSGVRSTSQLMKSPITTGAPSWTSSSRTRLIAASKSQPISMIRRFALSIAVRAWRK